MRSIESKFTEINDYQIDDPLFFSDIGLSNLEFVDNYKELLKESKYTSAANVLNSNDIDFFGAWIFNLLENRLKAIEDFLDDGQGKPDLVSYSDTMPKDKPEGYSWVSDVLENKEI